MNINDILNSPLVQDPWEFITRLHITNKQKRVVQLVPNGEQSAMLLSFLSGKDTLTCKPRQIGSSTITAAYLFWKWYSATDPIDIVLLSYKLKSSKHLFKMFRTFYNNLPAPLRRPLSEDNSTCMRFADTGAGVSAESAAGAGGLRSYTCVAVWMSEFAFSPDPAELMATAVAAVNDGQLIIESTANYYNDALHQEIMKAERGESDWNYLFFRWCDHHGYERALDSDDPYEIGEDEEKIRRRYDLSMEQMYWRHKQIQKLGWEKFRREYPLTIEDAYAQTGDAYFSPRDMQYVNVLKVPPTRELTWAVPHKGDKYAIGVDVSAGVGRDYSVIYILSAITYQPVYVYRDNMTPPSLLAERVANIATAYNNAKVLVESNNHGHVVLHALRFTHGYTNFWCDSDEKDWTTTTKSRTKMYSDMKKDIGSGKLNQLDNILVTELRSLVVDERGIVVVPKQLDSHADNVVALGLAIQCMQSVRLPKRNNMIDQFISNKRTKRTLHNSGAGSASNRRY